MDPFRSSSMMVNTVSVKRLRSRSRNLSISFMLTSPDLSVSMVSNVRYKRPTSLSRSIMASNSSFSTSTAGYFP